MTKSINTNAPTEHLRTLDILRGVAILGVIWHHFGYESFPSGWWITEFGSPGFIGTWASNAWMGVNLFFILSGFVLYLPIAIGHRKLNTKSEIFSFYARRAKRLLPLYYFSVFILAGLVAMPSVLGSLALLTVTFNFSKATFFPGVNWVLWSLGIEIWFSALFPIVVFSITKFRLRNVILGVLIFAFLTRIVGVLTPDAAVSNNPFINPIKDSIAGRLDDFILGMALSNIHARGYKIKWPLTGIAAGVLFCTLAGVFTDFAMSSARTQVAIVFSNSIFQVGAGLVILSTLSRKSLRFFPLELAGLMCYSLYVWHGVLMQHIHPQLHGSGTLRFIIILALVAWMSYRYVEFGHVRFTSRLLPKRDD